MTSEREEPALSEKDQEIIAVGASVASGCLPCTKFHIRAASRVGADEKEIMQAVRDATLVRMAATEVMARAGGLSPTAAGQPIADPTAERPVIREFVSISAAYAVSCSTSLEAHIGAARALGATNKQILAALEIACRIRDVANQKARSVAGSLMGQTDDETSGCDCAEGDAPPAERASGCASGVEGGADVETCSCGSDDGTALRRKERAR